MSGPYRARNLGLVCALHVIDGVCGLISERRQQNKLRSGLKVLVANWGHLGDVVAILPLLNAISRHPNVAEIGLLIGSWSRPVVDLADVSKRVHVIDHWMLDRSNKSFLAKMRNYFLQRMALTRALKKQQYDISIDTFSSFPSSHGITWNAGIPRRVGFSSAGLGPLLTDPIAWQPDDRPMLQHQLSLLAPIFGEGYPQTLSACYPGYRPAPVPDLKSDRAYIVIHMGPTNVRSWVPENWHILAKKLIERGYNLVATGGGGSELEAARSLGKNVSLNDLTGRLSWAQFVTVVANAKAIITVDSVTGHVGACFKVPTVVLTAGRQRLALWRPNNPRANVVMHAVGCAPCNRSEGCNAMACIKKIDVDQVLSSLERALDTAESDFKAL